MGWPPELGAIVGGMSLAHLKLLDDWRSSATRKDKRSSPAHVEDVQGPRHRPLAHASHGLRSEAGGSARFDIAPRFPEHPEGHEWRASVSEGPRPLCSLSYATGHDATQER